LAKAAGIAMEAIEKEISDSIEKEETV